MQVSLSNPRNLRNRNGKKRKDDDRHDMSRDGDQEIEKRYIYQKHGKPMQEAKSETDFSFEEDKKTAE